MAIHYFCCWDNFLTTKGNVFLIGKLKMKGSEWCYASNYCDRMHILNVSCGRKSWIVIETLNLQCDAIIVTDYLRHLLLSLKLSPIKYRLLIDFTELFKKHSVHFGLEESRVIVRGRFLFFRGVTGFVCYAFSREFTKIH